MPRLVKLYGMLERVRASELTTASCALDAVRQAQKRAAESRLSEEMATRAGVLSGSLLAMSAEQAIRPAATAKRDALGRLAELRGAELVEANELYQGARRELHQVETLVAKARSERVAMEQRTQQGLSDDRFLSRREWLKRSGRQAAP